jgi:hypothetical protein
VIQEILSELWPFVAIKMGSTDLSLLLQLFALDILVTPHYKKNLHFLLLQCLNPTVNAVVVFLPVVNSRHMISL